MSIIDSSCVVVSKATFTRIIIDEPPIAIFWSAGTIIPNNIGNIAINARKKLKNFGITTDLKCARIAFCQILQR